MQRLKDKIEKWFGEGIEYKGRLYDNVGVDYIITNPLYSHSNKLSISKFSVDDLENIFQYRIYLSINDLCSPECSFLNSLDRNVKLEKCKRIDDILDRTLRLYWNMFYIRMILWLLSDEQKILYILQNTK